MNARQKAKKYKKALMECYKLLSYKNHLLEQRDLKVIRVGASMTVDDIKLTSSVKVDLVRDELIYLLAKDETFRELVEFVSHRDEVMMKTTICASLRGIKPRLEDEDER